MGAFYAAKAAFVNEIHREDRLLHLKLRERDMLVFRYCPLYLFLSISLARSLALSPARSLSRCTALTASCT